MAMKVKQDVSDSMTFDEDSILFTSTQSTVETASSLWEEVSNNSVIEPKSPIITRSYKACPDDIDNEGEYGDAEESSLLFSQTIDITTHYKTVPVVTRDISSGTNNVMHNKSSGASESVILDTTSFVNDSSKSMDASGSLVLDESSMQTEAWDIYRALSSETGHGVVLNKSSGASESVTFDATSLINDTSVCHF